MHRGVYLDQHLQIDSNAGAAGRMKSRPHQGRMESPQDAGMAGAPRQRKDASKGTTKCGLEESTMPHEYRARTRRVSITTFSTPCSCPPSGRRAPSRPGQTAEEGYRPPRRLSNVSSNGCVVVATHASFAQEDSPVHAAELDELASSDGDDLSSLDSVDLKELGESLLEECPVDPRTSLLGVKGLAKGSLASGRDELELCQRNSSGLETDQNTDDSVGTNCKMPLGSGLVEGGSSSEDVCLKTQPSAKEPGRCCYAGVVQAEDVPATLEESASPTSKSCWEVSEASRVSKRNTAPNVGRLDDGRMATTAPSNSLGVRVENCTAQVGGRDGWSDNESQALNTLMLSDTNGCFTHPDNLTASVQPDGPISPKPLAHQQDRRSNGGSVSGSPRPQLRRPKCMIVCKGVSDVLRIPPPPPPPPVLSAGPSNSLEAYTFHPLRVLRSESQGQPYHNDVSISPIKSEAAKMAAPSIAGRNRTVDTSPKACSPTNPEPDSAGVASFSRAFTSVPAPARMGIKGSTFLATGTLSSLFTPRHLFFL